jgi:peroxidase
MGGLAEQHAAGACVGPTFQTIIAKQFQVLRTGDRFCWQNQNFNPDLAFTIAGTTLDDIIKRNTNTTLVLQSNVFIQLLRCTQFPEYVLEGDYAVPKSRKPPCGLSLLPNAVAVVMRSSFFPSADFRYS